MTWRQQLQRVRVDIALVAVLGVVGATTSFHFSGLLHPAYFVWDIDMPFDADPARIVRQMSNRFAHHGDVSVHPLFPLATIPFVTSLRWAWALDAVTAVRMFMAIAAGLWVAGLYMVVRTLGVRWLDALLLTLVGATSAAWMFWFAIPETFGLASLTIILGLVVTVLAQRRGLGASAHVVSGIATLGITITNWVVSLATAVAFLPWRRAVVVCIWALLGVVALWGLQRLFVPDTGLPLNVVDRFTWINAPETGGAWEVLRALFVHSMVAPVATVAHQGPPDTTTVQLSVQQIGLGSGGWLGVSATVAWLVLLGVGFWSFVRHKNDNRVRFVLAATIAAQVLLHLVFGEETFLYALHIVPLLVLFAAFAVQPRTAGVVRWIAIVYLLTATPNNWVQFSGAASFFDQDFVKPRADVLRAMGERPQDPWPRGIGHVVLGETGSSVQNKAYHEPGGGFSPAPGSFGVSLWVVDDNGKIVATSDSIPLDELHQRFDWSRRSGGRAPPLVTETPYYRSAWTLVNGKWRLDFEPRELGRSRLAVAVRSAGPAGGPIHQINRVVRGVSINDRWRLTASPASASVRLGKEGGERWWNPSGDANSIVSPSGWAFARIDFHGHAAWRLEIEDMRRMHVGNDVARDGLVERRTVHSLGLGIPDARFDASLQAQVAHLSMGLVDDVAFPADPVAAGKPRASAMAYVTAALARAGQMTTAARLSVHLAKHDFYGGYGAEADSPALALWALREVASRRNHRTYEESLWPHVQRKADFLYELVAAAGPVYAESASTAYPFVPRYVDPSLVANATNGGLIVGRVGLHYPVLYVNAVAFRGLSDAAWFADRLGKKDDARRWRTTAAELQQRWLMAFHTASDEMFAVESSLAKKIVKRIQGVVFKRPQQEANDYQLYGSAVWPSDVAAPERGAWRKLADLWWAKRRTADGTPRQLPYQWASYFDVAEAHQWLYLGKVDRAWKILDWFFHSGQASPGLYSWASLHHDGETDYGWYGIRGWVQPPRVMPDYRTAAEMLLLQLDMLGYVKETEAKQTLVIGPGIPAAWVDDDLWVKGLCTPLGNVDWYWRKSGMHVVIHGIGERPEVQLGAAFAVGRALRVDYRQGAVQDTCRGSQGAGHRSVRP